MNAACRRAVANVIAITEDVSPHGISGNADRKAGCFALAHVGWPALMVSESKYCLGRSSLVVPHQLTCARIGMVK